MSNPEPNQAENQALDPSNNPHPEPLAVANVQLKIPPFWPADPQIWFAQVEAQFATQGVTAQKTRFDYVVASLAPEFAQEVRDLILKPPTHQTYLALKDALIDRTAASEQRRLQQLFHAEDLGDRKPTQLLRRMQQLLGDKINTADAAFLRELFLQRLPSNVRMVLASTPAQDLSEVAQLADKIVEVAGSNSSPGVSTVANVAQPLISSASTIQTQISDLRQLVERVERLLSATQSPHRRRTTSRGRSPTPTPTTAIRPSSDSPVCWYHQRFGPSAHKCHSPCSYTAQGNEPASH